MEEEIQGLDERNGSKKRWKDRLLWEVKADGSTYTA
jgi:hypothetical protein